MGLEDQVGLQDHQAADQPEDQEPKSVLRESPKSCVESSYRNRHQQQENLDLNPSGGRHRGFRELQRISNRSINPTSCLAESKIVIAPAAPAKPSGRS